MLFVQKASPLAQSFLEGAVAFFQGGVDVIVPDAGIIFDLRRSAKLWWILLQAGLVMRTRRWTWFGGKIIWTSWAICRSSPSG